MENLSACSVNIDKSSQKTLPTESITTDERKRNCVTIVETISSWTDIPGMNLNVACAMAGNFKQESQWNPQSNNSNISYGIAHWAGARLNNLMAFSDDYFKIDKQLDFLKTELAGSQKYRQMVLDMSEVSIEEAAVIFSDRFERPNAKYAMLHNRKKYAREAFEIYGRRN